MVTEPKRQEPDIPPQKPDIQPEPRPEEIPQDKNLPEKNPRLCSFSDLLRLHFVPPGMDEHTAAAVQAAASCWPWFLRFREAILLKVFHRLNNPMISARASVLKCKLKPTTAADVSGFTSSFSAFTANTVNR